MGLSGIICGLTGCIHTRMPGENFQGELPEMSAHEKALRKELKEHVHQLAGEIGERNFLHYENLQKAVKYIKDEFEKSGYKVEVQEYSAENPSRGATMKMRGYQNFSHGGEKLYHNLIAEVPGKTRPDEILVIGAHYDSSPVDGNRAADDNASGVAAVLRLAKYFKDKPMDRTVRFVAFANEEPPFFWTEKMGSYVYAKSCKDRKENIVGMISVESIGYYSEEKNSQHYPLCFSWFYPTTGNFIAFVGNSGSSRFIKDCIASFRKNCKFPSEGAALPRMIPAVGFSDQWGFWKMGYPAFMLTDTAPFRNPNYHTCNDNPDTLDYSRMARVTAGLQGIITDLAITKQDVL